MLSVISITSALAAEAGHGENPGDGVGQRFRQLPGETFTLM